MAYAAADKQPALAVLVAPPIAGTLR